MNRVVITGIGAITPLGNTARESWQAAKQGVNGIGPITKVDVSEMPAKLAGEIKDFDAGLYMDKKEARRMDMFCQFGMAAGIMAMEDASFGEAMPQSERFGVIMGTGTGGLETIEKQSVILHEKGYKRINPLLVPVMICNILSGNLAIRFGLRGHCSCVVTACSTGTNAIGDAFRLIKHGYQDAVLAGGAEAAITPLGLAGFIALSALSTASDVTRASIPFDLERNGFVMGEGAGAVVLEEYEHAKARGAKIYAEVLGYGLTADAYHMTAPDPEGRGAAEAMRLALWEGNITPELVDYINAHGTSTPYNDKTETLAVKKALGDSAREICMSSTKSMTGHLLGAAGAVEAIFTAMSIQDSFVPPTINYQVPDPECDLDIVPNVGRAMGVRYALSNSLGFGGHNATLLLGKVD